MYDLDYYEKFIFDESIICPEDPTATPGRVQQYREYYKTKYGICREACPSLIVEIGVRAGYSAWAFLQAYSWLVYRGYDNGSTRHGGFTGAMDWAARILRPYNATIIRCDTQQVDALPGLDINQADFFHVDGDHSRDGVKHDLDLAYQHTRAGGMILVDDITYVKSVRVGVTEWLNKMDEAVLAEFRPSLRGEMLIRKMVPLVPKGDQPPVKAMAGM